MKKVNSMLATAVLGSFLLLSGFSDPDEYQTYGFSDPDKYPTAAILSSVIGCMDVNEPDAGLVGCACMMDYLRENFPYQKFREADAKMRVTGGMPDDLREYAGSGMPDDFREHVEKGIIECYKYK